MPSAVPFTIRRSSKFKGEETAVSRFRSPYGGFVKLLKSCRNYGIFYLLFKHRERLEKGTSAPGVFSLPGVFSP